MYVDVHTHTINTDNQQVINVVNIIYKLFNRFLDGEIPVFFSVGIHPWDINQEYDLSEFPEILKTNNVIAVGESGLDKVHKETFERQYEIFLRMIDFSEKFRKPLIIHAVRTYSDIISIRKKKKPTMPWIIHGFHGSPESAQQMIRHGMYLSFCEMFYKNENQAVNVLNSIPIDRIFFETDVSGRNIVEVYEKAATLMDVDVDFLEKKVFDNFKKVFSNGKLEEQDTYFSR